MWRSYWLRVRLDSISMGAAEVRFVRDVFRLSQRRLAKSMNVAPYTVVRWEKGDSTPTGLQEDVLRALHNLAMQFRHTNDAERTAVVASLIGLGIGALIVSQLSKI